MSSRVTQILVGYVGGSWGVLQFLDWLVGHFMLSKSIVDLFLCFVLLMLPAALLLAWYSARAAVPLAKRVVGVGVPLNVVVAAVVLFIVFHGKRLGATTEVVAVHDDSGALVERRIPKNEYRKRLALFPFEVRSGNPPDPDGAWLAHGVPELLSDDLNQDSFVDVTNDYEFKDALHKAHLDVDSVVPLALARQLAADRHLESLVIGTVTRDGGQYRVHVALHSSQSGHVIAEHDAAGADLFALADQLSLALRRDLGLAAAHLESAPDLPVSEITTKSLPAFAEFIRAYNRDFEDDPAGMLAHLEKAVAIDPTFALADFALFSAYFQTHDQEKIQRSLDRTLVNAYKLPEPKRFQFNSIRHQLRGELDKQQAVLTNWVTLYPDSPEAKLRLADHYSQAGKWDLAMATYQQVLDLDPSSTRAMRQLAGLRMARGESEEAFSVYRRFLTQFPNDAAIHAKLAEQYLAAGRLDDAKRSYERALALDPEQLGAAIGLSGVVFAQGQREAAVASLRRLLADAKLPVDRVQIYDELVSDYQLTGQMKLALATFEERQRDYARLETPMNTLREQLDRSRLYVRGGRVDEARQTIARTAADAASNVNLLFALQLSQVELADEADDAAALAEHLPVLEASAHKFGLEELRPLFLQYQARIAELRGDNKAARDAWQEATRLDRSSARSIIGLGRSLRLVGDVDGARAQLQRAVAQFPADAEARYQLALTDREKRPVEARAELAAALAIWAPADADYKLAREARALATSFGVAAK